MASTRARTIAGIAALGAGAVLAAGVIAGVASAAETTTPSATPNATTAPSAPPRGTTDGSAPGGTLGAPPAAGGIDESQPQRSDETLLTGDTLTKVTEAALAKYPGATVLRAETDSDGVYEVHLTTADGTRVTVEVGSDFTVTGEEQMGTPPVGAPAPGAPDATLPDTSGSGTSGAALTTTTSAV